MYEIKYTIMQAESASKTIKNYKVHMSPYHFYRHHDQVCQLKRANHLGRGEEESQNPKGNKNRRDSQLYPRGAKFRNG